MSSSTASSFTSADLTKVILHGVNWVLARVLSGMESVGEVVVGVLGLDQSRFQYVIDGMDEDDWKNAAEVQRKREAQELERHYVSKDIAAAEGKRGAAPEAAAEVNSV